MIASWTRGFSAARAASKHAIAPTKSKSLGAALFHGGKIVALGFNIYTKTHPESRAGNYTRCIHAEQSALVKRQHYDAGGQIMYVYRETADGNPACSRPCPNCMVLLRIGGIRRIRFINEKGKPEEIRL